ncbi:hypothetical protein GY15_08850 [Delftia sp. 670]|nr:hypothetical protein GY15_08850 [Delftia sp. 670]
MQRVVGVNGVRPQADHAHAGAAVVQRLAIGQLDLHDRGLRQALLQVARYGVGLAAEQRAHADEDELVTAEARQHVGAAQMGGQALSHGAQQCVAGLVAVLVVHVLEAVQVDEAHHHAFLAACAARNQPAQLVGEAAPVGQAGQRVQQGQCRQLLVGLAQAGDELLALHALGDEVGEQAQQALGLGAQRLGGLAGRAQRAVELAVGKAYRGAGVGANAQFTRGLGVAPAGTDIGRVHAAFVQGALAQRVAPGDDQAFGNLHLARVARVQHALLALFFVDGGEIGGLQMRTLFEHLQQGPRQLFQRMRLGHGLGQALDKGLHEIPLEMTTEADCPRA